MFTQKEASSIRHEFWTVFGKYMSPVPSAEGMKINWVNYHTGIKDLYFRMDAGPKSATISISLEHKSGEIRGLYFEKLRELETLLHSALGELWQWNEDVSVDGKLLSRVSKEIHDVSIFNKDQWPELITFFKPRIIALDEFWQNAKYTFEDFV
jgi:hypothetical protein